MGNRVNVSDGVGLLVDSVGATVGTLFSTGEPVGCDVGGDDGVPVGAIVGANDVDIGALVGAWPSVGLFVGDKVGAMVDGEEVGLWPVVGDAVRETGESEGVAVGL